MSKANRERGLWVRIIIVLVTVELHLVLEYERMRFSF